VPLSEREISRTRMEQPDLASCDLCARAGEWLGRRSNFSVQEWEPLTDHRETKTLGGKSKTQARDTENETKTTQKKLLLLWLHEQAVRNKTRRERNSKGIDDCRHQDRTDRSQIRKPKTGSLTSKKKNEAGKISGKTRSRCNSDLTEMIRPSGKKY
jgi:hypothetical protein